MSAPKPHSEARDEMPSRYEKPVLQRRPFVIGIISFFILMLAIFAIVWGLLRYWSHEPWPQPRPPGAPSADARWNTQAPQIQANPPPDLAKVREAEDRRLHAFHWNDGTHTDATIPIEAAMKLLSDAAAQNQLTTVLPAPYPATPVQLQDQKSRETSPPQVPNP